MIILEIKVLGVLMGILSGFRRLFCLIPSPTDLLLNVFILIAEHVPFHIFRGPDFQNLSSYDHLFSYFLLLFLFGAWLLIILQSLDLDILYMLYYFWRRLLWDFVFRGNPHILLFLLLFLFAFFLLLSLFLLILFLSLHDLLFEQLMELPLGFEGLINFVHFIASFTAHKSVPLSAKIFLLALLLFNLLIEYEFKSIAESKLPFGVGLLELL